MRDVLLSDEELSRYTFAGAEARVPLIYREAGQHNPRQIMAASRYYRVMGALRLVLPVLVLLVIGLFLFYSGVIRDLLDDGSKDPALSFDNPTMRGLELQMLNPRITGMDNNNNPYIITARVAFQKKISPHLITLKQIEGDITFQDSGTWVFIQAAQGIFNNKTDHIVLSDNIELYADNGYQAYLEKADIDLRTGKITSDDAVWIIGPSMKIKANGIEYVHQKRIIRFINGTHTVFNGG